MSSIRQYNFSTVAEDISPIPMRTKAVKRNLSLSLSLTATGILEMYDWMHDLGMEDGDIMEIEDLCKPGPSMEMTYEQSALPPYPHCSTLKCLKLGKPPRKKVKRSPVKNNILKLNKSGQNKTQRKLNKSSNF